MVKSVEKKERPGHQGPRTVTGLARSVRDRGRLALAIDKLPGRTPREKLNALEELVKRKPR